MTFKGLHVLNSIIENSNKHYVDKVIIGIDKEVVNDYSSDIELLCKQNRVKYCFKNEEYSLNSDFGIAVSWRWLIKADTMKLIVLHDSILPKYRGFAPLVNMLINGEKEIGVTALFASKQYDRGEIILQKTTPVNYPLKIEFAIQMISNLYNDIIQEIFLNFSKCSQLNSYAQDESIASYSLWRDESDYFINWDYSSKKIKRFINAVGFPYSGAKTNISDNIVIVIADGELYEDIQIMNRDVGKIIFYDNKNPVVVCGTGLFKITEGYYEETGESIFPLKNFRIRFK